MAYFRAYRAEKASYLYNNDGEKSHAPSLKNLPPIIPHETFFSNPQNDYSQTRLIPLEGCCASEAAQLLNDLRLPSFSMTVCFSETKLPF
uniref:Uncharacterized protein n=1 Tax=Oryza rufipogon TaxID=4529 RepID=A0A0E0NHD2_ORYRU